MRALTTVRGGHWTSSSRRNRFSSTTPKLNCKSCPVATACTPTSYSYRTPAVLVRMQRMQRKFGTFLPRSADNAEVGTLISEFREADKALENVSPKLHTPLRLIHKRRDADAARHSSSRPASTGETRGPTSSGSSRTSHTSMTSSTNPSSRPASRRTWLRRGTSPSRRRITS